MTFLWSEPYRRTGRVVNFFFWLMRNPLLYQAARPESRNKGVTH